ncbi:MAG: citramalate synthase [Chloroflexota bacterium]|nr:citramalate synthase [Chloroflexota bacterium]
MGQAPVTLYDTTLRDGAQMEGISLSVEDKLRITQRLDQLGIHYIEGGWPGSNPKDDEFFKRARELPLEHAALTAFGSTRRANGSVEDDANLKGLLDSGAPVVTIVGKASEMQVTQVLETSLEENLAMVRESIEYLRAHGRRVLFDAEHFFDGFAANPDYALACIRVAADAGAEYVVLCDTNGGSLPVDVFNATHRAVQEASTSVGVHCHNDAEVAVANSIAAVQAGATQVQGTINGYGERCGNTNLISVIGNLKLKLGIDCVTDEQLERLTEMHRFVAEVANMPPNRYQAYVGESAFSHKGGLHASATAKVESAYQHVEPQLVGNARHVVVSELSGRGNLAMKLKEEGLEDAVPKERLTDLVDLVKRREAEGYQYEGAEASFRLLVERALDGYKPPFELVDFLVVMEKRRRPGAAEPDDQALSEAMVKVRVGGSLAHTVAEGNGPVNALDLALRRALEQSYPHLGAVSLSDYKVRVVEQGPAGTGAVVRVLVQSTDGERSWSTVGASGNIIEASWQALTDSLEYALLVR